MKLRSDSVRALASTCRIYGEIFLFLAELARGMWAKGRPEWQGRRVLPSAGTPHGEQEETLFSIIASLMHFEIVIVGLDHGFAEQMT